MKSFFISTMMILFAFSAVFAKAPDHPFGHMEGQAFSLGVLVGTPDKSTLKDQQLKGGAEVVKVFEGSEAGRIDLQKGDIIVKFNGRKIGEPEDLKDAIEDLEKTGDFEIVVMRNGKKLVKTAHIEPQAKKIKRRMRVRVDRDNDGQDIDIDVDAPPEVFEHMMGVPTEVKGGYLGVEAKELSDQLKEYFQVKNGVLIERVIEDSPAQKARLKAGDVIVKINNKKINDVADLIRTVNYYDPGDRVTIYFSRKGKDKKALVKLGKKEGHPFPWQHMRWNPDEEEEYHNFRGPGHIFFRPGGKAPVLKQILKEQDRDIFAL